MIRPALLIAVALAIAAPRPAVADDARKPEVAVAVVVNAAAGVKLVASRKTTVAISMERGLRRDRRLLVVDQDDRLAAKSNSIPNEQVSEARGLLTAGETMLRRRQAKPAALKLQGAANQLARVLAWTQKQDLADAQLFLGTAQAIAGDTKAALATFQALLVWRPDALPDPELQASIVMPLWGQAQDQLGKLGTGSIEIASEPDGALAYVDGNLVGFTPTVADGLVEGVHYVTLRRAGSMRKVEPVKVSAKAAARLSVELEASARADELVDATALLEGRLGDPIARAEAQAGLAQIGELLGVEHVVVVTVLPGDGQYRTYVYATDGGARLGTTDVAVGDRDPEEAFAVAGTALYKQVAQAKLRARRVVARDDGPRGPSIFSRWWFWTAAGGVVATAIAVPLIVRATDGPDPLTCPGGQSCGTIIFRY